MKKKIQLFEIKDSETLDTDTKEPKVNTPEQNKKTKRK